MMAYKVLDLFSGAGGLSRGFYDAGYDVVLGVDFDEAALKTFKANHGKAEAMKLDLFDHSNIDVIINFLKEKDIKLDVLVGGPPCQGFSVAGPRDMNDGFKTEFAFFTSKCEIYQILSNVRNKILEWALVLEDNGIIGEGMAFTDEEKKKAQDTGIVNNYTNNFYSDVSDIEMEQG